jgi:hypothetical protein
MASIFNAALTRSKKNNDFACIDYHTESGINPLDVIGAENSNHHRSNIIMLRGVNHRYMAAIAPGEYHKVTARDPSLWDYEVMKARRDKKQASKARAAAQAPLALAGQKGASKSGK